MGRHRISLGVTLGMAALLVIGGLGASGQGASPAMDAGDWPMFKGDAGRGGLGSDGPDGQPVVRWTFAADGAITGSISIVDGTVFAASGDGVLHALDVATGEVRWETTAGVMVASGPSVTDGMVVGFDPDGHLSTLDAATGEPGWVSSVALDGPTYPTVGDGAIIVGTGDGWLVAFDTTDGTERWRTQVSPAGGVRSPAYADGIVYAGTTGSGFVALDARDGTERWRFDTGAFATGTAVVAEGIAYVGASGSGDPGRLWALDAETGELRWSVDAAWFTPAVEDGVAYAGSGALGVAAFDTRDGSPLWTFDAGSFVRPVAVAEHVVYVPADDARKVIALDAATGAELWQVPVDGLNDCCIAIADGAVFVGTSVGSVIAIASEPAASPSASGRVPSASAGAVVNPFRIVRTLGPTVTGLERPSALAVTPAGEIVVADAAGSVVVLSPDGERLRSWGSRGTGPGEFGFGERTPWVAVGPDGRVYVTEAGNARVSVFEADGTFVRHLGSFGDEPGQFVVAYQVIAGPSGDVVVVDDGNRTLTRFDASGGVDWRIGDGASDDHDLQGYKHVGAFDAAGRLWITNDETNRVVALDADGTKVDAFGEPGMGDGQLAGSCAVDLDAGANAYVFDCATPRIQVFDPEHRLIAAWSEPAGLPFGESYDFAPDGRLYAVGTGELAGSIVVMEVALPDVTD